jgi:hypothetical protein
MAVLAFARSRPWLFGAVLSLLAGARPAAQGQATPIEANVKAVFLYNFAKYVTWPAASIGARSPSELRVCVTADDPFFALLTSAVQGEEIDGRPLVPVALEGLDDAKDCQILYVGDSRSADARAWLNAVRGRQVLTVADGPLNDETVIAFVRDDARVRFDINRGAAVSHRLNVSSKLLRLARQVRDR